jgi:RNA polymerase sigma-70 factor (ECF subfamily)
MAGYVTTRATGNFRGERRSNGVEGTVATPVEARRGEDREILRGVERERVERAARGDREAFEQLVADHLQQVWKVVYRILRHREDAEDVVQEVFLTAFRSLPSFRGDSKFSTWLHHIAVTRALNHLDRASEKVQRASQPLESEDEDTPAPIATLEDRSQTPLQALESKELMRRLAECLGKLPPAWRAVLALRDAESKSYEEIAAILAIALGTVRSRLARARLTLKDCVEGRAS